MCRSCGRCETTKHCDAGRYVHDTLGQYDLFSPWMKKFVGTWAPFWPWYHNALKFVYYTCTLAAWLWQKSATR